jgi:hypothetical protein
MRTLLLIVCSLAVIVPAGAQAPRTRVSIDGDRWLINGRVTYPGAAAEGRLMNVRMVNAVFEDDRPRDAWPAVLPATFDPDANTDLFIRRLPDYVAAGVLGFTVGLQGGSPDYEGAHNSAFNADGSLRPGYLAMAPWSFSDCSTSASTGARQPTCLARWLAATPSGRPP